MSEEHERADEGASLTVDQAADLLAGEAEPQYHPNTDDAPDDAPPDDEGEAEAAGEIRPPHSWDAEAKARFKELPEDVQALIADREGERDRAVSRAFQEAAEERKRAEAEAVEARQMSEALDQLIPQAAQTFAGKWDGIDWAGWAVEDPQAAFQGRMAYEAEQAQLAQLQAAQAEAESLQHIRYVAEQSEALKGVAPELADPQHGPARREAVAQFLEGLGASEAQMHGLSAVEAGLVWDAMRWRMAEAGLARRGEMESRPRTVRPSAASGERGAGRSAREALAKLSRTGSVEDAVAYLRRRNGG